MSAVTLVTSRMRYSSRNIELTLAIEDLPGELSRLIEDHAAVFGVGVVAEIGAFVEEAVAAGVEHDAQGIGVLLEPVADGEVAELGRVAVPAHGVAAGPMAAGCRADVSSAIVMPSPVLKRVPRTLARSQPGPR